MSDIYADRVLEHSTTTGTGAYTLAGNVTGYVRFGDAPGMIDGGTCPYYAEDVDANGVPLGGYEIGIGTWGAGGILTRTSVQVSSNAGAAVSWAAGTRRIALSITAAAFATRQAALVSGTNIKTVNNLSLIGAGNLSTAQVIAIACSDETTAIAAGTAKVTLRMPYAFTLSAVRASLTAAQASGSILTVDINESGTSVLSTKLTIDNTEKTSVTATTAAVLSDTTLADDAEITIDIDQVGDGSAKGLKVYLIGAPA